MVARSHVWWPGLDHDIARMVQSCQVCQENQRASRRVKITPWPFPERPWSRLHVDFGGPFKGHYFLVVVDAFSKWVEVPRVLFQYRTTPHDVTGRAPCELLLGWVVKTPLDVLHLDLRSRALLKQLKQKLAADRGCHPWPLPESGAPVFARIFRPGPDWSAGHVVSPASASSLLVRMSDGTPWHRHADHVRPRLATSAAPSGSQHAVQPTTPAAASTAPGAGATRATVAPRASPVPPARPTAGARVTQAAPNTATPASTHVLRRSERLRRPPDRYSLG
ncbi:uncharacterized protein LOC144141993 [Haemaphysalis longicornis]